MVACRPLVALLGVLFCADPLEIPPYTSVPLPSFDTPNINHAAADVGDGSKHTIGIFIVVSDSDYFINDEWVTLIVSEVAIGFAVL